MLRDAVDAFRVHGVEPLVLSTGDVVGTFADDYRRLSVETLHLPFSRDLRFAMRFARLIRNADVAVVHLHTERANAALGIVARATGARVVRTVHSVFTYTGRLRLIRIAERALLRAMGVQHISIGPSVEENERVRLKNPTRRVDNWIGPRFRPPTAEERARARAAYGLDDTTIAITTIGNCSDVKNHRALLEALPAIAAGVHRRIVYLHAGTGAAEPDERALAGTLGTSTVEVRFLGSVFDVLPLLWASDVYCMPSRYEGVGIAALEALACGVPSVLAEVPGLRGVHEPGPSVRFVAPEASVIAPTVLELFGQGVGMGSAALEVAARVRSARRMKTQVESLVSIYRGG